MADIYESDEEKYANESFENDSDAEIPEYNIDTDEQGSSSDEEMEQTVRIGGLQMRNPVFSRNRGHNERSAHFSKPHLGAYNSSSEDEHDVVIGETIAEINTKPMQMLEGITPRSFMAESSTSVCKWGQAGSKTTVKEVRVVSARSSRTIQSVKEPESTEDNDSNAEEHIEDCEDQPNENSASNNESFNEEFEDEQSGSEWEEEEDDDDVELDGMYNDAFTTEQDNRKLEPSIEELLANTDDSDDSGDVRSVQNKLTINQSSASTINKNESNPANCTDLVSREPINHKSYTILKHDSYITNKAKSSPAPRLNVQRTDSYRMSDRKTISACSLANTVIVTETETESGECIEPRVEIHLNSHTPTSFNSENYLCHMNLVKRSDDSKFKFRLSAPRKSWSFTNERMREIERHNHILLRKILSQKPTVSSHSLNSAKSKPKFASLPPTTRKTNAAVNRKKQQRQIDLDNEILKRKIEAISLRRRVF